MFSWNTKLNLPFSVGELEKEKKKKPKQNNIVKLEGRDEGAINKTASTQNSAQMEGDKNETVRKHGK